MTDEQTHDTSFFQVIAQLCMEIAKELIAKRILR